MKSWPVQNRADSLTVNFFYLQRAVGKKIGYGYNPATWNDTQLEEVQEIIDEGVRTYYNPPPLPPPYARTGQDVHEWTFLRPLWHFSTSANQREYPLPDDFQHPIGQINFNDSDGNFFEPIKFSTVQRVSALEARQDFTGVPQIATFRPNESTGTNPQTLILTLHPTPEEVYRMQLQYQSYPKRVTKDQPHMLGGPVHAQGILLACIAVAEARMIGANGPEYMRFIERLAGNIARDSQRTAQSIGYNRDGGAVFHGRGSARQAGLLFYDDVTYEGDIYSD